MTDFSLEIYRCYIMQLNGEKIEVFRDNRSLGISEATVEKTYC